MQTAGLEMLQEPQPQSSQTQQAPQSPAKSSKPKGKAALSSVRQPKPKLQRKNAPPNRTKSLPRNFIGRKEVVKPAQRDRSPIRQTEEDQVRQQNTRQMIQQTPLARVSRRSSMEGGMGYSNHQPVAAAAQPGQQMHLARVPRRSSMGAAPGYTAQQHTTPPQHVPQQQQKPLYGQARRNSMGGTQALPRVSRRVSIGNQAVGVEQTRWGQKPQRRSSLTNTSNYQYSSTAPVKPPQSQVQCSGEIDISNNSTLSRSYHGENNDSFDFSRRSSLSSHDSRFAEQDRGTFVKNVELGYGDYDDSFGSSAVDSLDLRRGATSNKVEPRTKAQQKLPRRHSIDSLGDSSCGSAYAADSLDLRRGRAPGPSRRMSNDSLESSCGSTAVDSLDLRRNSKLRHKSDVGYDDLGYGDAQPSTPQAQDIGYGDARSSRAQPVDLGYGDAAPSRQLDDEDDDADTSDSSCYSHAADSLNMRQMRKKYDAAPLIENDLGYGDAKPSSAGLGYGDARPTNAQTSGVLGYENAKPTVRSDDDSEVDSLDSGSYYSYAADSINMRQMRKKQDLGYGEAKPSSADLGYEDCALTRKISDDPGYEVAAPSQRSNDGIDLGYEDADPSKERHEGHGNVGYDKSAPSLRKYIEDDEDDDVSSCGSASFGNKRGTASTTNMDDEENDSENNDSEKTPLDYMTQIVMGYSKNAGGAPRRPSLDSSVGDSSCFSYACNSVDLRQRHQKQPLPKAAASAYHEVYDDDSEDYSDGDDSYGGRGYINGGMLGFGKPESGQQIERRLSCDSLANDSVDLRKFGRKKPPGNKQRRESMDSLCSDVSMISGGGVDPEYLHHVLGYAMDASLGSNEVPFEISGLERDTKVINSTILNNDSFTSIPSDDDDLLEETKYEAKHKRFAATAKDKRMIGRCSSQPLDHMRRHNQLYPDSCSSEESYSDDDVTESSDNNANYLPRLPAGNTKMKKPQQQLEARANVVNIPTRQLPRA